MSFSFISSIRQQNSNNSRALVSIHDFCQNISKVYASQDTLRNIVINFITPYIKEMLLRKIVLSSRTPSGIHRNTVFKKIAC